MGNCLFDSLNHYIKEKNSHELRLHIVSYIKKHPDLFKQDVIANGFSSVDEYCKIMSQNGRDGDGVALQACVLLYNAKVVIHFSDNKRSCIYSSLRDNEDGITSNNAVKEYHIKYVPGHYAIYRE